MHSGKKAYPSLFVLPVAYKVNSLLSYLYIFNSAPSIGLPVTESNIKIWLLFEEFLFLETTDKSLTIIESIKIAQSDLKSKSLLSEAIIQ